MISAKQIKAVALWIDGKTKKEISETLKVSERTVHYWFKNPEFLKFLREETDKFLTSLRTTLINHQTHLALKAKSQMVQFSATKDLLDRADILIYKSIENEEEIIEDDGLLEALNNTPEGLWEDDEN